MNNIKCPGCLNKIMSLVDETDKQYKLYCAVCDRFKDVRKTDENIIVQNELTDSEELERLRIEKNRLSLKKK